MSKRNWIYLVLAAVIALLTVEGTRRRVDSAQPQLRRMLQSDDSKPDWYTPRPSSERD
jgi:hypothetical protein